MPGRIWLGALFTCVALASADSVSAQSSRYGMNLRTISGAQADKMVELGAGTARVVFGWDTIEPNCKGCFDCDHHRHLAEPNLDVYFHGTDLRAYRMLVVAAETAIRAANPAARVLGPEVSHHALKDGWYAAAMRSIGDLFDIVTVHWYPDGPNLEFMMDQMVRPFAGGKQVWLTEAGMKPCETVFGEAGLHKPPGVPVVPSLHSEPSVVEERV